MQARHGGPQGLLCPGTPVTARALSVWAYTEPIHPRGASIYDYYNMSPSRASMDIWLKVGSAQKASYRFPKHYPNKNDTSVDPK